MKRGISLAALLFLATAALAQWKDDGLLAPPPSRSGSIYPADAKKELAHAFAAARKQHKRVLLDFGGDWCYDCHLLEYNFQSDPAIRALLDANYVVAHIDVGDYDRNLDLAKRYKTNIKHGVPALAVLASDGKVLYGDPGGFFEHARGMTRRSILDFLEQWAPARKKP